LSIESNNTPDEQSSLDIALIGMSGRFPGARSVDEFWRNLRSGIESISFFSDEELKEAGIDPSLLTDPNYVKASAILDGSDLFDASFFGYSPREAEMMDPQHRLFLECAWKALENAGYDADRYDGPIGVYAGASMNTYLLHSSLLYNLDTDDLATVIGDDKDFLTTRVSYKMNLKGPSVTVGTGCSTSLVAVHMACQSLLNQECDMVLAGGVSVRVPHKAGYIYRQGGIPSPDGHCRAFDAKAEGTVLGSGVGVVLLKRLSDAIADGDCIYAVIKGSAINNDGSAKVGYTAPSVDGQSKVIAEALANAGVDADTISYVEAHGTGTALGDPIEIAALTRAFRNYTDKKGFCAIGSVKTNIGHLDVAAGVAGLIKTAMALKHRIIPPILHFEKANPAIDFPNSPFYVNTQLSEWEPQQYPLRAGVSSFGVGGTNVHVILEGAPDVEASGKSRPWQLLLLSAKTGTALETATANLVNHLKCYPDLNLADVAYTLQNGRKAFSHRRMVVCQDLDDAVTTLETLEPKRVLTSLQEPINRDVVFVFSGQGAQYVNMGLELFETEPEFKGQIDLCSELLKSHLSLDLRDILYPHDRTAEEAADMLKQTFITQPALFTIEYALARLWMSWGVHPVAMVGHSIGEYVAACLAGVLSLEDALSLVATRGRLMQELPGGSMLSVFLAEEELRPLLGENLSLAVINGPALCVVSGKKEAVADLEKQLSGKDIAYRYLHTSHAFHSKTTEPVIKTFSEQVKRVTLNAPQIPFLSNVTGTWITPGEATSPDYWARHLRQTVRFSDCLQELFKEPNRVLLEVGPGETSSMLARLHPDKSKEQIVLSSTHHPKEERSDVAFILSTLGQLWLAGVKVNWSGFYADESRYRLPLPTYPFERQRYWSEAGTRLHLATAAAPSQPEALDELAHTEMARSEPEARNTYDYYSNGIEQTLADIWQGTLGIKQINYDDNFFNLGGNSLIAVRIFAEIERIFGRRLPLAILIKAPTIKQLAAALREGDGTTSWTSLVEIQPGDSKPPIFFIHAAGGNLLIYRDLVRHLGPDQPVYGLQAQGMDGKEPFLTRIEDMAAKYVQEIQTVQPEGPYLLGGYCMGGTVALEMAQQLQAQNREVALLALMETYNFSNVPNSLFDKVYYRIQQVEFHLRNLLLSDRKMAFFQEKVKVAWSRRYVLFGAILSKLGLNFHLGNGQPSALFDVWEACDRASLEYVPKVYAGRITQFLPKKHYACFTGPELGWDKLAAGGLETYDLPVYPRGMLVEPFVPLLAEKLKVCIQNALELETSEKSNKVILHQ
jgi:phthiocerol/phenolphthiocerol synthesis type-I polyketide synthase E